METYVVKVHEDYTSWCSPITNELHRLDGPAIEWSNGKLHRLDGSAVEWKYDHKEWWVDGKKLTESEFNKRNRSCEGKIVEIDGKKYRLEEII